MLKIPDAINLASGKKWYTCRRCGRAYNEVEIPYKMGTIIPMVGATLTGATSGATAIVDNVKLISGSWADGTAVGIIWCTSPTGIDFDTGHWGSKDEIITGS